MKADAGTSGAKGHSGGLEEGVLPLDKDALRLNEAQWAPAVPEQLD